MRPIKETAELTIATIREARGKAGAAQVLFNEREQIFTLGPQAGAAASGRKAPRRARRAEADAAALRAGAPVRVVLDPRRGTVQRITPLAPGEVERFTARRELLEDVAKPVRLDVRSIDPTTFNVVERHLKFPAFKLCTKVIPNYAKAKEIFDFCASLSCHLGGTPAVSPCIPFQYVVDGCYARAHQMRRIITGPKYGYCCEKVFSFANQNNDSLGVQAGKWGGCCVTWWYHVAPLVRVRIKLWAKFSFVVALVIDPSMFDKPVLLSTWLSAQENATCTSNAKVSMYSIQPGSAYTPANYQGTAFSTDPSYTATEATLLAYKNLTTCS